MVSLEKADFINFIFALDSNIHKPSVLLQSNFIEIALRQGCSPVNLLHIFRTPFPRNTSEGLLLHSHESFNIKGFQFLQPHLIYAANYPKSPNASASQKHLKD